MDEAEIAGRWNFSPTQTDCTLFFMSSDIAFALHRSLVWGRHTTAVGFLLISAGQTLSQGHLISLGCTSD